MQYSNRGIKVDERMRTTARHIYACGDITGDFPFTHAASYEAVVTITNAIIRGRLKGYKKISPLRSKPHLLGIILVPPLNPP